MSASFVPSGGDGGRNLKTLNIMTKVLRGSALIDELGTVLFTPYQNNPTENTPWTLLAVSANGKLQCSKKKVNLVITLNRTSDIDLLIGQLTRQAAGLTAELLKASVQRKYLRSS